jgi:mercuric ion transport protein
MNARKENIAIVSVGAVACAACCAGPILGFLAAIGLGTATGFALFGAAALIVGALAAIVVLQRRRRVPACAATPTAVTVELSSARTPR